MMSHFIFCTIFLLSILSCGEDSKKINQPKTTTMKDEPIARNDLKAPEIGIIKSLTLDLSENGDRCGFFNPDFKEANSSFICLEPGSKNIVYLFSSVPEVALYSRGLSLDELENDRITLTMEPNGLKPSDYDNGQTFNLKSQSIYERFTLDFKIVSVSENSVGIEYRVSSFDYIREGESNNLKVGMFAKDLVLRNFTGEFKESAVDRCVFLSEFDKLNLEPLLCVSGSSSIKGSPRTQFVSMFEKISKDEIVEERIHSTLRKGQYSVGDKFRLYQYYNDKFLETEITISDFVEDESIVINFEIMEIIPLSVQVNDI